MQAHGSVLMVVDQPNTIGALPIAVLAGFVVVLFAASVLWLLPVWFQRSAPPALAREGA